MTLDPMRIQDSMRIQSSMRIEGSMGVQDAGHSIKAKNHLQDI